MDRVNFRVNGEQRSVGCESRSDQTLLDYLRVSCELRGTKYFCREGGCGACVVTAARPGAPPQAVNSCLVSVTSCQDWSITTIEGVGNRLKGYHPLQTTLAKYNGTQCGYCTPGWIMAMYSLLQSKKKLTMLEIEQSFGSNICRCTGYRPILEALKKFACDALDPQTIPDIEDLNICHKTGQSCRKRECSESDWCIVDAADVEVPKSIEFELNDGRFWATVFSIRAIFDVLRRKGDDSYMLIAGNTAKGACPLQEYPRVLIDISGVQELKGYRFDQNLVLGAGATLTETIDLFEYLAATRDDFWYLKEFVIHLLLVGNIPMRNLGTIAGNLMIKYNNCETPSDVFLLLESVGAYITILDANGSQTKVTPLQFLDVDMRSKVILNILLPPLSRNYKFVSYKIMPRSQNVHAIVNSAFLVRLSPDATVTEARLVYGGLSADVTHATTTERFLLGRKLFTNETLQGALRSLDREIVVDENPPEPSAKYRKDLAVNLFYKSMLSLCPAKTVRTCFASGAITLNRTRPVSRGQQAVPTNPTIYPLTKPVEKLEGVIQCAGEAPYTEDLPRQPREVFGALVLTTVPLGNIVAIDPNPALKHPGVIAFYSAKDIPGDNAFTLGEKGKKYSAEEVFCSGAVKYNGQVVGVIVAELRTIADYAAKLVNIKYSNVKKPDVDVKVTKKDPNRASLIKEFKGTDKGTDVFKVIKGDETIYQQNHFCMETMVCVAKPTEEGLELHCATQHMDSVQMFTSRALKIPENKLDVYVRRLGGAYGLKISRPTQIAIVSGLVTLKLNRPCRVILPMDVLLKSIGKRLPCSTDYEVAVDKLGRIQYCNESLYQDYGYMSNGNEPINSGVFTTYYNCYKKSRWSCKAYKATTDTASNTRARAPGTLEAVAAAEFIMERISYELTLDPVEVRLGNLDPEFNDIKEMVEKLKKDSNYINRRAAVDKFNADNRWKKRGLRFSFMRFMSSLQPYLDVNLSVYRDDGSVAITTSGIEIGQGINTKAVQIASFFLGIPMDKIQIKPNNTIVAPNGVQTAGSVTSLNIAIGVQQCCEELLRRLAPIKSKRPNDTWEELIKAAYEDKVDLQTHGFVPEAPKHTAFGVVLVEMEIDVLTGEWEVLRVDLLEDAGLSINPRVDVGQVEGAFIMGLGYWTSEEFKLDPDTGRVLTDRTWNYYVPLARDIPQDFRVYFREKSFSDRRVLGAKSISEPSILLSVAVAFALREAIVAARRDAGLPTNKWFQIDGPYTREAIQLATATKYTEFKLY